MAYEDFTEMPVWKAAFNLLLYVYKVTKDYPTDERFGLTSDTRRSANSIVHNIAERLSEKWLKLECKPWFARQGKPCTPAFQTASEDFGRFEAKDKTRFYKISRGSAYELMSQILVAQALLYIDEATKNELIPQCRKIISDLNALIKTLEKG